MAEEDRLFQHFLYHFILPFVFVFLIWELSTDHRETLRKKLVAFITAKTTAKMNKFLERKKNKLFHSLSEFLKAQPGGGILLEIGAGSGANFNYYPKCCTVLCLELNNEFEGYLEKSAEKCLKGKYGGVIVGDAQNMKACIEDHSVDVVVCSIVLCCIPDVQAVLNEIHRILKPNGRFYYIEHVLAPRHTWKGRLFRMIQNKINPIWKTINDGCNINRNTGETIKEFGFSRLDQHEANKDKKFEMIDTVIYGIATK